MSWEYPCHRADVTGRQILTKEKPIGKAYGALQELQEKVPIAADVQISGLEVTQAYVENNTLVLRGAVRKVYTPGGGDSLEERVAALENALAGASLTLNLAFVGNRLKITGGISFGEIAHPVNGDGVLVTECD